MGAWRARALGRGRMQTNGMPTRKLYESKVKPIKLRGEQSALASVA